MKKINLNVIAYYHLYYPETASQDNKKENRRFIEVLLNYITNDILNQAKKVFKSHLPVIYVYTANK